MAFKGITAFVLGNNGEGGGGGGGTSNYNELSNHPQINGNELIGNKSSGDLGIKIGNVPIDGNAYLSDLEKSYNQITPTYTSQTFHGVTFVVNKDKSITANGTPDSDITLTVAHFVPSESNLKLSGTPADGSSSKYYLYVVDNVTSEHTVDEYSADPVDIPVSANDCSIKLRIKSGVTCTNVVFKPMVRYSTDPATYIPSYTSNDELESMIGNKVDKVSGKGLSTNDYTDADQEDVAKVDGLVSSVGGLTSRVGIAEGKVRTLEGEMLSVQNALDTKVDKVAGKGLSTNDYDDTDKGKVDSLGTASTKNSTSVVTESSDLVESGAVKDLVGWGNKNLLPNQAISPTISFGITFTVNADGSVTANETSTHSSSSYLTIIGGFGSEKILLPDWLEIGKNYIISDVNNGVKVLIAFYDENGDSIVNYEDTRFTVPSNAVYFGVFVYVGVSTHPSNVTVYPMIRKATETDPTYEPYHVPLKDVVPNKCDNSVIGTVEDGATASQAYAVRSHFIRNGAFCTVTQAISSGGTLTEGTNYTSGDVASEFGLYIPIFNNAGFHNSIFRGKNLGSSLTNAQKTAIANGTFEDMYIGDYWEISGVKYRIAHFDYWLNCGDNVCTNHHIVVVPDSALVSKRMNAKVDNVDTTAGAYVNSEMRTTNLADAKTIVNAAFGADNILGYREYMQNAVTDSYESAGAWVNADIELMSEIMVYGSNIFHNVACGTVVPNLNTVNKTQLALFRLDPSYIVCKNVAQTDRLHWWLRDVVSATAFAVVYNAGVANYNGASNSYGVRPAFGIK